MIMCYKQTNFKNKILKLISELIEIKNKLNAISNNISNNLNIELKNSFDLS